MQVTSHNFEVCLGLLGRFVPNDRDDDDDDDDDDVLIRNVRALSPNFEALQFAIR